MSPLTRRAEECEKLAARAKTEAERQRQLALKRHWERLERIEHWLDRQISPFARPRRARRSKPAVAPDAHAA